MEIYLFIFYKNFLIKLLGTPNIADALPIASPSDNPEAIICSTTATISTIPPLNKCKYMNNYLLQELA